MNQQLSFRLLPAINFRSSASPHEISMQSRHIRMNMFDLEDTLVADLRCLFYAVAIVDHPHGRAPGTERLDMMRDAATTSAPSKDGERERAQYRRGVFLVAGAAMAWSSAGVLVRSTAADNWTTLFWRSVFAALFLALSIAIRDGRSAARGFARLGLPGLGIALAFATSMTCFIVGLRETSVANVLIFQAMAPFVAAILGWFWLGERISLGAGAAILASMAGVLVMVSDSVAKGRILGDVVSALMGISFALVIVESRRHRDVAMMPAMCLGLVLTGLAALPFAHFAPTLRDLSLLALFGVAQMGVALMLFTTGVRLIPAADAGLVSLLEVILAPLWVWLAFGEDPGPRTLLGGALVLSAVVGHTVFEKRSAAASARKPGP